MNLKKWLNAYN